MRALKVFLSLLLVVALIVSLCSFQFLLLVQHKLLRADFYLAELSSSGFYEEVRLTLENRLRLQTDALRLPPEIVDGVITQEWVRLESQNLVGGLLAYLDGSADIPVLDYETLVGLLLDNAEQLAANSLGMIGLAAGDVLRDYVEKEIASSLSGLPFSANWEGTQKLEAIKALDAVAALLARLKWTFLASAFFSLAMFALLVLAWREDLRWLNWSAPSLVIGGLLTVLPSVFALLLQRANPAVLPSLVKSTFHDLTAVVPLDVLASVTASLVQKLLLALLLYGSLLILLGLGLMITVPPASKFLRVKRAL